MIILDYKDRRPIYEQIIDKMEELMLLGVLVKISRCRPSEIWPWSFRSIPIRFSGHTRSWSGAATFIR